MEGAKPCSPISPMAMAGIFSGQGREWPNSPPDYATEYGVQNVGTEQVESSIPGSAEYVSYTMFMFSAYD